ncbi:MAG: hypothetical protein B7X08_05585, partial [Acidocella sp. 20-63-7]
MSAKPTISDRIAARNPQKALARALVLRGEGQYPRAFKLFIAAAQAGITEAEREAGFCYLNGIGVPHNADEAGRWFLRAANKDDAQARRHMALLSLSGLQAAKLGSGVTSLFNQRTENAAADYPAALAWVLPAAQAGDMDAQVLTGFLYASAPPPLSDDTKARYWYGQAADGGSPYGHLGLGVLELPLAKGDDETFAAVDHLHRAAEADLPAAHYYLGVIYEKAIGRGADLPRAAQHYSHAAKGGIRDAQGRYGFMLLRGIGVKANKVEGETWLRRAGMAGDPYAAAIVGNIYAQSGGDLPPNYAEAANWFRLAAEAGHREAARTLGMLYNTGLGVPQNPDEAAIWFRRAAEAGDNVAQADLAGLMLSKRTSPTLTEPAPVHEWFEQTAESGDPIAAFNYAVCLAQGVGIERDDARA